MKRKFTLLAAIFAFTGLTSYSQVNLIEGWDFDNSGIATFSYEDHTCPVYLDGWDVVEGVDPSDADSFNPDDFNNTNLNRWAVRAEMLYQEEPEDGNYQHVRIQRYEWMKDAGWLHYFGPEQTVNIEGGQAYTLRFDYRVNPAQDTTSLSGYQEEDGFATDTVPAALLIKIEGFPDSIIPLQSRAHLDWNKDDINKNWDKKTIVYTTPNNVEKMTICLGVRSGKIKEWGGNINMWMDIDNVELYKGELQSITEGIATKLNVYSQNNSICINGLEGDNTVYIYSVSGVVVKTQQTVSESIEIPIEGKGLYFVKVGADSYKVIVR